MSERPGGAAAGPWKRFLAVLALASGCSAQPAPPALPPPAPSAEPAEPPLAEPPPAETPEAEFRKRPPPGSSEAGFSVPIPAEERLPNGLRVLFLESHGAPVVAIHVLVARGAEQAAPGVGGFAGAMLLMGTKTRSATQLSDALEAIGATYGAGADLDSTGVQATVLAPEAPRALAILADVVQNPAFPDEEIARVRSRRITSLAEESDDPRAVLRNAISEAIYPPGHPYRASALGDEEAIRHVTRADLVRFHRANVQPDVTTVVIAGEIDRGKMLEAVKESFGGWRGRAAPAPAPRDPSSKKGEGARVIVVDRPGASQTQVAVAGVGASRTSKDHDALMVLGTVLTRRINLNLREKRGATYGVSAQFAFRRGAGPFSAGGAVVREQTAEAVRQIFAEIEQLREQPISPGELADMRSILGALSARFETARESAASLSPMAIYGLSNDEYLTRRVRLQMVTVEGLQKAARAYLKPDKLKVVLVGDAARIADGARQLGLGEVEIRRPKGPPPQPRTPSLHGALPGEEPPAEGL